MASNKQLFDKQYVYELTTAAIILFLIDKGYENEKTLNEHEIADFVIDRFTQIVSSVMDGSSD